MVGQGNHHLGRGAVVVGAGLEDHLADLVAEVEAASDEEGHVAVALIVEAVLDLVLLDHLGLP